MRWYNFFGRPVPNKILGKKRLKFGTIFDNIQLWSQMSPERIDMAKNPKSWWSTATPLTLGENVGDLWSVNRKIISKFIDPP